MAQKKDRCLTGGFVQAVTQLNTTSKVTVTMFHEQIQEVFSLLGRPESLEENEVTLALLLFPERTPRFADYFRDHIEEDMKDGMLLSTRRKPGLKDKLQQFQVQI